MTAVIRVFAPAKVNLCLTVHGRRPDGYHDLSSLVVFADAGDTVVLEPGDSFALTVTGPMAAHIGARNLISLAAARLAVEAPQLQPGSVTLHKILPVGAGLGGGSSDVAAYLRAVRQANPGIAPEIGWRRIALSLGADVPVCVAGRATWMHGIGGKLAPLDAPFRRLPAVLVNPGIALSTADVFDALDAGPVPELPLRNVTPVLCDGIDALAELSNDLEYPARQLVPQISAVRDILEMTTGVRLVGMSGSGATFFGIYCDASQAQAAAEEIAAARLGWWVMATMLGDAPGMAGSV